MLSLFSKAGFDLEGSAGGIDLIIDGFDDAGGEDLLVVAVINIDGKLIAAAGGADDLAKGRPRGD